MTANNIEMPSRVGGGVALARTRRMECCVCSDDAGRFQQHWNRDTGFGICRRCVDWLQSRGETGAEMLNLYGVEGVNYAAPSPPPAPPSPEERADRIALAEREERAVYDAQCERMGRAGGSNDSLD